MGKTKRIGIIGLVLIIILGLVGSMAYFSDYAVTDAAGTAGTVAIALDSDINLLNKDGMDILNPGDSRDASFLITNMGNKSIDVRTTIALTINSPYYDLVFSGDSNTQSEYDLYLASDVDMGYLFETVDGTKYISTEALNDSDVNKGNVGYIPKSGATPIDTKTIEGNVITYVLPEYSLNGNSAVYAEVETIDGINDYFHDNDFVLVFHRLTGNTWQESVISIDVIVEAKQHENTGAGWDIVAQEQIMHGSLSQFVVDEELIITDLNGDVQ